MEEVYTACLEALLADVPELKHIDLNTGQLNSQAMPPLNYPALLLRFEVGEYEDRLEDVQTGFMRVTASVIHRVYGRTHSLETPQLRAAALEHLRLNRKVKWALHGVAGENFTALVNRSFMDDDRPDLRIYSLTFDTTITEQPPRRKFIRWTDAAAGGGRGPELYVDTKPD